MNHRQPEESHHPETLAAFLAPTNRRTAGFTLVEMLVVIAIIGVLIAILLPAVQSARESARRVRCANNLKQIGIALMHYHATYSSYPASDAIALPRGCRFPSGAWAADCRGTPMFVSLLPYLEQGSIWERFDSEAPWGWGTGLEAHPEIKAGIDVYRCPSTGAYNSKKDRRDYYGVMGGARRTTRAERGDLFQDGLFAINRWRQLGDIRDGASNTFMVGESVHPSFWGVWPGYTQPARGGYTPWFFGSSCNRRNNCGTRLHHVGRSVRSTKYPVNSSIMPIYDNEDNEPPFGSDHPGGAQFVYADGHVRLVFDEIDMAAYRGQSTYSSLDRIGDH